MQEEGREEREKEGGGQVVRLIKLTAAAIWTIIFPKSSLHPRP